MPSASAATPSSTIPFFACCRYETGPLTRTKWPAYMSCGHADRSASDSVIVASSAWHFVYFFWKQDMGDEPYDRDYALPLDPTIQEFAELPMPWANRIGLDINARIIGAGLSAFLLRYLMSNPATPRGHRFPQVMPRVFRAPSATRVSCLQGHFARGVSRG
jgi:hypothetical protein